MTAAGMTLLFLAMGVLMLCMALLVRAFPVREEIQEPEASPTAELAQSATPPADENARVAALTAVALAFAERGASAAGGGQRPGRDSPGPWVIIGRQAMMQARRRG